MQIRPLRVQDLDFACALSEAEGWNQTERDWKFLLSGKNNVCLIADEGGRLVGTATALFHPPGLAWIGMVLVDRQMRGQGIGRMLMSEIIKRLNHCKSLKLDATPAGLSLYRKLGFKDEFTIYRMTNSSLHENQGSSLDFALRIDKNNIINVLQSDKRIFGSDRSILLNYLMENEPRRAYVVLDADNAGGYIFGRTGLRYSYIGPACGISLHHVIKLIAGVLESHPGGPIAMDVLQDKGELIKWLEHQGFEIQRPFTRMYLKSNCYSGEPGFQYLISGPEFG